MIKYQMTVELRQSSQQKDYLTYGIECIDEEEGNSRKLISVSDISSKMELVRNLVEKLNRGKLSPIHLLDVIEDQLS